MSATGTHRRLCFRLRHSNGSGKDTESMEELTRIGELKSSGPTCSFSYPGYTPGLMYVHIDVRMRMYIPLTRLTVSNCSASHTLPFEESRKVNRASSGAGEMSVIWSPEYARQTRILHLYTCVQRQSPFSARCRHLYGRCSLAVTCSGFRYIATKKLRAPQEDRAGLCHTNKPVGFSIQARVAMMDIA